ncbi:MAG: hypothetical protein ACRD0Q_01240 [Acidimicrobiales bacterium]
MNSDEVSVERALGRLEARMDALAQQLEAHTAQDQANFMALSAKLDTIKAPSISKKWAAGIGATAAGVVTAAAQVAQALGYLP